MRPADQIEEILRTATETLERARARHHRASITAAQAWRDPTPSDDDPDDDDRTERDSDGRDRDPGDEGVEVRRRRPILDSEPR